MKRIISTVLALVMLSMSFGLSVIGLGVVEGENTDLVCTPIEREAIIDMLNFVNLDKEAVGLGGVDFRNLEIGNKIYRYELTENGFEVKDYYSYPIMYDGKVVLMATGCMKDGKTHFQISTYEADILSASDMDNVAFVYDADGLYLYDGVEFEYVDVFDEVVNNRESLKEYIDSVSLPYENTTLTCTNNLTELTSAIIISDTKNKSDLGFYDKYSSEYDIQASPIDGYYFCTVDYVSQNSYDKICWAASVAMVANYRNKTSYTAEDIAKAYYGESDFNKPLNLVYVSQLLRENYSCTGYRSSDILLSDNQIKKNISAGYPIIAGFVIPDGGSVHGHTGVIDVIHTKANYIRVADPEQGRIYLERDFLHEDQAGYGEYVGETKSGKRMYMGSQVSRWLEGE